MAADAVENKEADRTTEARKAEATCTWQTITWRSSFGRLRHLIGQPSHFQRLRDYKFIR